jgi:hypothetical protein
MNMTKTVITRAQAIGLMCMESADSLPYRVLNAAGKWAISEFVGKYAARENVMEAWFKKVEDTANNCDPEETVIIEMRRTISKSGKPETFRMNDSHFDWMINEEYKPQPTAAGQAIILFESMTDEQKGSFLNALHNRLPMLGTAMSDLRKAGINHDGLTDIQVYINYYELKATPETVECEICQGTGMDSRDPRRPCDHCDGEGKVEL